MVTKKKNYTFDENVCEFVKNVLCEPKKKKDDKFDILWISSWKISGDNDNI